MPALKHSLLISGDLSKPCPIGCLKVLGSVIDCSKFQHLNWNCQFVIFIYILNKDDTSRLAMNKTVIRWGLMVTGVFLSAVALAQSLPLFGLARFDQTQFGTALPATPVPMLPTWALVIMAVMLWGLSFFIKPSRYVRPLTTVSYTHLRAHET